MEGAEALFKELHSGVLGPYWAQGRELVETQYAGEAHMKVPEARRRQKKAEEGQKARRSQKVPEAVPGQGRGGDVSPQHCTCAVRGRC